MPQSLAKNLIHLVFSTKNREPLLNDALRPHLHGYLAGILKDLDSPALAINSVADHIHVLLNLNKNRALADVIMECKRGTSKWIKTQGMESSNFHWQAGYGAFSVSQSAVDEVKTYIASQAEHHRIKSFQEEYQAMLRRYEIDYDERFLWD